MTYPILVIFCLPQKETPFIGNVPILIAYIGEVKASQRLLLGDNSLLREPFFILTIVTSVLFIPTEYFIVLNLKQVDAFAGSEIRSPKFQARKAKVPLAKELLRPTQHM